MPDNKLKLAVVGCGAIAGVGHIPAAQHVDEVKLVALVDSATARAETLARRFRVPRAASTLSEVAGEVDVVLLAGPLQARPALAAEALRTGLHVLCEPAIAATAIEATALLRAATRARRLLAVAHIGRFFPNRIRLRELLMAGALGKVNRAYIQECLPPAPPARPGYPFHEAASCNGVLQDLGAHSLDTLFWWFGDPLLFTYEDDAIEGPERNANVRISFRAEIEAGVRLSATHPLDNWIRVVGEKGMLAVPVHSPLLLHQSLGGKARTRPVAWRMRAIERAAAEQIRDFAQSIAEQRPPRATGVDGLRVAQFLEACYANRKALLHPSTMG